MLRRVVSILSLILISNVYADTAKTDDQDPYETLNRLTFGVNKGIDAILMKPVAYIYLSYLPWPFQTGIKNFFDNWRCVSNVANDVLQGKFGYATYDLSRLLINTTIGLFGVFDPATSLGLEQRKEDFGQTLYTWGYKESSYLVIPFIGPSTIRDAIGLTVDYFALSIWPWIESDWKYAFLAVDYVDIRAGFLRRQSVLDVVAIDEYTFTRNAYFQYRQYLVTGSEENSEEEADNLSAAASANASQKDNSIPIPLPPPMLTPNEPPQ